MDTEDEYNWISLDEEDNDLERCSDEGPSSSPSSSFDVTVSNEIIEETERKMSRSCSNDFMLRFDNQRRVFVRQSNCMEGVTLALYEWWNTMLRLMEAQVNKIIAYKEALSKLP